MSKLHIHKISLSDGQKRRMKTAFKKRKTVVVGLTHDSITDGSYHILLTYLQHRSVNRVFKTKTGLRLVLGYEQLLKNKEGGLSRK